MGYNEKEIAHILTMVGLSIDKLGLTGRVANPLKADNIYYIGALLLRPEWDLRRIPYLGSKTIKDLRQALESQSLVVGQFSEESDQIKALFSDVPEPSSHDFVKAYTEYFKRMPSPTSDSTIIIQLDLDEKLAALVPDPKTAFREVAQAAFKQSVREAVNATFDNELPSPAQEILNPEKIATKAFAFEIDPDTVNPSALLKDFIREAAGSSHTKQSVSAAVNRAMAEMATQQAQDLKDHLKSHYQTPAV